MKIAILGNMNNGHFALLRYLRDLNIDAHLLIFRDDGYGGSDHFSIKSDTWNFSKWQPFIHSLPAVNGYGQVIGVTFFNRIILYTAYIIKTIFKIHNAHHTKPPNRSEIEQLKMILSKYDTYIGSGATPAILTSLGIRLDLFHAYSIGIEYVNEPNFLSRYKSKNIIIRYIANQMRKQQVHSIRNARNCFNTELSRTKKAYEEINVTPEVVAIPFVYPYEKVRSKEFSIVLSNTLVRLKQYDFVITSQVRHLWKKTKNFSNDEWKKISKNNNWMIEAYAEFLKLRPKSNSVLILFEYGQDYSHSKSLGEKLNIANRIIWLPIMQRKEIMLIIKLSSVSIGEFYEDNVLWGSLGWECISQGCPLIHAFNISHQDFLEHYGYSPPPVLPAGSMSEIRDHLLHLYDDEIYRKNIGLNSKAWFDKNNGYSAARNLARILDKLNHLS
jgi:hypothetical protein